MRLSTIILIAGAISCSASAETVNVSGSIDKLRLASSVHPNLAENEAVFTLSPMQPHCTWIKVAPESNSYISALLMGKAQEKSVTVWYDDSTCQTITIELQ